MELSGNLLCSENYVRFCNELYDIAPSLEDTMVKLKKGFCYIADDINVGRLVINLHASASLKGISGDEEIFAQEWEDKDSLQFLFPTGESGFASFTFFHVPGHTWTKEENSTAEFLANIIFSVTGYSQTMDLLRKSMVTDMVTGMANSNGFMSYGRTLAAKRQLSGFACIFLNIKNFKYVNKKVGYENGNAVLRLYAQKVSDFLLPDEKAGRFGGDNFSILVKKEHLEDFLTHIKDIEIVTQIKNETVDFHLGCVAGVAMANEHAGIVELCNCASVAYQVAAKAQNDTFYTIYQDKMMEQLLKEKEVSMCFQPALDANEFLAYYQPKVRLEDNRLCGAEALARWKHNNSLINPMDFIPILEKNGSVCKLDFYILEKVCQDIRRWMKEGKDIVKISVNFSRWHLLNPKISEQILAIIEKYEIDPSYIEIEITETANHENFEALTNMMIQLKKHNITFSIDDFGTGYSSLSLLKNLSADVLKIDKSFLDTGNDDSDAKKQILFENIIRIANGLNMDVICEGVETDEQKEFLKNINCNMAQGYYYDKPLPVEKFEQYLKQQQYTYS